MQKMYGIYRVEKLKSMGNLKGSLMHAFREQPTMNADPERTPDNIMLTDTHSVAETLQRYAERAQTINKKIRADSVRAIEVMATASPERMAEMSMPERLQYLKDCLAFSNAEFGAENLLHAQIHMDETTAHLTAFYIPITAKSNKKGEIKIGLDAKTLMGDRKKFQQRQTDFYERVSKKYGLERGEPGSRATHQTVKDWYKQANLAVASLEPSPFKQTYLQKQREIKRKAEKQADKELAEKEKAQKEQLNADYHNRIEQAEREVRWLIEEETWERINKQEELIDVLTYEQNQLADELEDAMKVIEDSIGLHTESVFDRMKKTAVTLTHFVKARLNELLNDCKATLNCDWYVKKNYLEKIDYTANEYRNFGGKEWLNENGQVVEQERAIVRNMENQQNRPSMGMRF